MKIGSVIVTFNPQLEQLKTVLGAIQGQVAVIEIIDNGSDNIKGIQHLVQEYSNVEIRRLESNLGIAKAQNIGFSKLSQKGCTWALTLDQDTIVPVDYVNSLISVMPLEHAGVITGAYIDIKWSEQKTETVRLSRTPPIEEVNEEISSGNLVSVSAWKNVGGFDEKLFIDYVDFEFDYNLIENGYKIYRVNGAEFQHEIGTPVKQKPRISRMLCLKGHELFDHSAQRLYYINRNRIIVRKRYPKFGSPRRVLIREVLNLREIFLMESPRLLKFRYAIRGIIHGVFYK